MRFEVHKVVLLLASAFLAGAAESHHSVPTKFDTSSEYTIRGIIKAIRWVNPHSSMDIEVTNESGKVKTMRVEMNALDTIRRFSGKMGFSTDDFVIGDVGATIYQLLDNNNWQKITEWHAHIGQDWGQYTHDD